MKKTILSLTIFTAGLFSCSDFLEEEMVATLTQDRYKSEPGIEELVNGIYEGLRFHHAFEWSYAITNYGTDEFTNGGGLDYVIWNTYVATLDPTEGRVLSPFWDNMYAQINLANIGIRDIPQVLSGELMDTRLGEVYFLRGYNYFRLITQFGSIPLSLSPNESIKLDWPKAPESEVFDVIISDLRKAQELLPSQPAQQGRFTKSAAQHFLAKVYLTRASEQYSGIGASSDLDSAAFFADEVIFNSHHSLANDFHDLFDYTEVNGPNEQNPEIILASQFNNNQSLLGRYGNRVHLYFLSVYQNLPGMVRDIANGREFQRARPTDYALDVYDRQNDSRFYKSFKTAYLANNPNTLPLWEEDNAPNPGLVGQPKFDVGDTSIIYIVNSNDDNRFSLSYIANSAPTVLVRNVSDGESNWNISRYPSLSKYIDPLRQSVGDERGTRDGILARLGETYLIAAEAYGRKGEYNTALEYINELRRRAGYKEGEQRSNVYYLAEDVPLGETSSTESNMEVTMDAFTPGTAEATKELYPASVTTVEQAFIHFILNERARELMGEFHRWVDLARTLTLVERVRAFNQEASPNITSKHLRRPIPQAHLDLIAIDGKPLTPEEKVAYQNSGW